MNFCSALIIMSLIPNCAERVRGSEREKKECVRGVRALCSEDPSGGEVHTGTWDLGSGSW